MTISNADDAIKRLHGELSTLHEAMASLRDSLPSGEDKGKARRYADRIERALQSLERLM